MKAIILAAGVGSRLGNPFPKSLSLLPGGERILGRQIRIYRELGIRDITVVVGFKKELIMEEFPMVNYCYNPVYYLTNTSKSLLAGLEYMHDDVIWSNGDVVFDPASIEELLKAKGSAVLVDKSECGEEEVKYKTVSNGRISEISKIVQSGEGEAVGINKISRQDLAIFTQALRTCDDNDYFERALEFSIARGVNFSAVDISAHRCIEVDFEEDLIKARHMFSQENNEQAIIQQLGNMPNAQNNPMLGTPLPIRAGASTIASAINANHAITANMPNTAVGL